MNVLVVEIFVAVLFFGFGILGTASYSRKGDGSSFLASIILFAISAFAAAFTVTNLIAP